MNQTVTINISGIVFHIEVDAYEELKSYLNKIKSYFNDSQEREEIMADIESRIAELFSEKITQMNQVVLMRDVQEVIEIMGKPEQYVTEEDEQEETAEKTQSNRSGGEKKFFRNPDERVLGGVCSGIAAYFGFDTIWMRLFFVMTTLFMGFGPAIYIILWIVIPEAKTASDKLQMKGEPINIDNIGKKVEEEADKVNEKLKNINTSKVGHALEQFFAGLGNVLKTIFLAFGKVLGVALLMLGLLLAVWFLVGLFDDSIILTYTSSGVSALESGAFFELVFSSEDQFTIFLAGLIIVLAIPIIGLILGGLKMLFGFSTNNGLGISLTILWFIGLFTLATLAIIVATEHKANEKISAVKLLPSAYHAYALKANEDNVPGELMLEADEFMIAVKDDRFYCNELELTVEKSETDSFELVVVTKAKGKTSKDAMGRARAVDYHMQVQDSNLVFDRFWSTLKEHKIRGQQVKLVLKLPVGKTIYLDDSLDGLIYNIENVTDTWDHYMLGKKWIMLDEGLTCLDCEDIEGVSSSELDSVLTKELSISGN
ncbi:MAG: PspC domain-containing protein [Flavobacteriales bacterium]|nr:PspC domain-containing protein [Flavobacteriales bacterium]